MATHGHLDRQLRDLDRLVALIDGVFAVAMTLLVLDLRLPPQAADLPSALRQMLPGFLIYLIVFASVAGYWIIHHRTFRYVAHTDAAVTMLSLINLMSITLFPVVASIVGSHPAEPIATVCVSANSLFYCLSAWAIWAYAAAHPRLLTAEAEHVRLRHEANVMLVVGACMALAIPLAFVGVGLAYADWILSTPLAAAVGRRLEAAAD
jgi:uncharacterized membrane protein